MADVCNTIDKKIYILQYINKTIGFNNMDSLTPKYLTTSLRVKDIV